MLEILPAVIFKIWSENLEMPLPNLITIATTSNVWHSLQAFSHESGNSLRRKGTFCMITNELWHFTKCYAFSTIRASSALPWHIVLCPQLPSFPQRSQQEPLGFWLLAMASHNLEKMTDSWRCTCVPCFMYSYCVLICLAELPPSDYL